MSWLGSLQTQTTHNGGGRRPSLSWRYGTPLGRTRMLLPVETVRAASLPEDYLEWCIGFNSGQVIDDDRYLRECVNMGVPVRTACAINDAIHTVLVAAGIPRDVQGSDERAQAATVIMAMGARQLEQAGRGVLKQKVQSIVVDTGASKTFLDVEAEQYMENTRASQARIQVADSKSCLRGRTEGTLRAHTLNLSGYECVEAVSPEIDLRPTTVPGLSKDLLSVDPFYRIDRYNILLRQPDYEDGVSELYRPPRDGRPAVRIPLTYDWVGRGGWHMHYVPAKAVTKDDLACIAAAIKDMQQERSEAKAMAFNAAAMSEQEMRDVHRALAGDAVMVREIITRRGDEVISSSTEGTKEDSKTFVSGHDVDPAWASKLQAAKQLGCVIGYAPGERELLGVKAGMKQAFKRMSRKDFHERMGHHGVCPGCRVCQMAKGVTRRIYTKVDPFRETRPGHTWAMDGCTFRHRSQQGCKHLCVLRDVASGAFHLIPLFRKSDIVEAFGEWVRDIRANPIYQHMPYPVVSVVRTDNAGEWGRTASKWLDMLADIEPRVEMHHVSPCAHAKENGYAEAAVKTVELSIKAGLYSAGLPPSYWQYCCADTLFLLNRLPALSDDAVAPGDGDRALPLEILSRGYYSRRQLYRELAYFVPTGTPALIADAKVPGSSLAPKCRWGVACGMYREQPIWFDPWTKVQFRSKSYSAYRLRDGMSYGAFLNVPIAESAQSRLRLDEDAEDDPLLEVDLVVPAQVLMVAPATIIDETARVQAKLSDQAYVDLGHLHHGGTMPVSAGRVMRTDPRSGVLSYVDIQADKTMLESEFSDKPAADISPQDIDHSQEYIMPEPAPISDDEEDEADPQQLDKDGDMTADGDIQELQGNPLFADQCDFFTLIIECGCSDWSLWH